MATVVMIFWQAVLAMTVVRRYRYSKRVGNTNLRMEHTFVIELENFSPPDDFILGVDLPENYSGSENDRGHPPTNFITLRISLLMEMWTQ